MQTQSYEPQVADRQVHRGFARAALRLSAAIRALDQVDRLSLMRLPVLGTAFQEASGRSAAVAAWDSLGATKTLDRLLHALSQAGLALELRGKRGSAPSLSGLPMYLYQYATGHVE